MPQSARISRGVRVSGLSFAGASAAKEAEQTQSKILMKILATKSSRTTGLIRFTALSQDTQAFHDEISQRRRRQQQTHRDEESALVIGQRQTLCIHAEDAGD